MIDPSDDRRTQLSPQLAMRVAILGGVAFAIFGVIFLRLWFLQILSGDQYVAQAAGNRIRNVVIQAPRGEMIDRNGERLVTNRRAVSVVVSPTRLPDDAAERTRVLRRLSRVLGKSTRPTRCRFGSGRAVEYRRLIPLECQVRQNMTVLPYAHVIVDPDASRPVYSYLAERAQEFPGVEIQNAWLRDYPLGSVGAHLFGTVGQIDEDELRLERFRGVRGGTIVGKNGLELAYDEYLRGRNGAQRIMVDAHGRARRQLSPREPVQGATLQLSIDARLQRAGQRALETGISLARANGNPANGGAFVALDPRSGEVLAMGSNPTFDPNLFTRPITHREYAERFGEAANDPLFNRATQSAFAIGSTFKPVTAAAALAAGVVTETTPYVDTGTWTSGAQERTNAGGAVYGTVTMRRALSVSVDTYFYELGARLNRDPEANPRGGPLQEWARRFGFGRPTGIELYEESGTVPDPRWRDDLGRKERRCRARERRPYCGYSDMRPWTVGDNVSLAIGQGDFLATPLQLAVAYAALANGGTIVRPHVGLRVLNARRQVIERISPRPVRRFTIPGLETIRAGLLDSTTQPDGTSSDVFADFGKPVYGKTGTAERVNEPDQSWYAAYVPDRERPIVVAAVIEDGGYGAQAAAPAVRQILSQWFYGRTGSVVSGTSTTN